MKAFDESLSVVCIDVFLLRLRGAAGQCPGEPQGRAIEIKTDQNNQTCFKRGIKSSDPPPDLQLG